MKDGGPAFPVPDTIPDGTGDGTFGMTLRDWFAGQAMSALIPTGVYCDYEHVSAIAYAQADAMIAERERTK